MSFAKIKYKYEITVPNICMFIFSLYLYNFQFKYLKFLKNIKIFRSLIIFKYFYVNFVILKNV